jgi:hypothetical protein
MNRGSDAAGPPDGDSLRAVCSNRVRVPAARKESGGVVGESPSSPAGRREGRMRCRVANGVNVAVDDHESFFAGLVSGAELISTRRR